VICVRVLFPATFGHGVKSIPHDFLHGGFPESPIVEDPHFRRTAVQGKRWMVKQALFIFLFLFCNAIGRMPLSYGQASRSPEEIWQSLETLSPSEREKRLIEGARTENAVVWYTNSSLENAERYIREFKRTYPFTKPRVWRAKSLDVTQRIIAEARTGQFLADLIKPSADLLSPLLQENLIGRYDSPFRAPFPAHARGPFWTNIAYAFRVFAYNPKKLARKDAPKSWEDLLQPRFRGAILFDESSLHEVISLLSAWGREKTVDYFDRLSQQKLLIRAGRDNMLKLMMAGEAPLTVTAYAYRSEALRARAAPIDWLAQDLMPTLVYPLTLAKNAPHPYTAALFYDFLISASGQRLMAQEGRVVPHRIVEPIYPRMKALKATLASKRAQINSLVLTQRYHSEGLRILDNVILKRSR